MGGERQLLIIIFKWEIFVFTWMHKNAMTCTFSAYQILKKRKSWTSSQVGSRQVSSGPLHTILDLDLCYSTSVVG